MFRKIMQKKATPPVRTSLAAEAELVHYDHGSAVFTSVELVLGSFCLQMFERLMLVNATYFDALTRTGSFSYLI